MLMQQVFLSYTYNPHPDHVAETETLRRQVMVVLESMDLRVVTGEDVGGESLNDEIRGRIENADALVALLTPWRDKLGNKTHPPWVADEFAHARAHDKPALRIVHTDLAPAGMYAAHEYAAFSPDKTADTLLKLLRTLAVWKKQSGRPMEIEIAPDVAASRFDTNHVESCQFQLLCDYKETDWRAATIWPQPGALYAYLPGVPDRAKLRLRLKHQNETWQSEYSSPVGRVQLSRRTP